MRAILIILLLTKITCTIAQNRRILEISKTVQLGELFKSLENTHNVRFSYDPDLLKDKQTSLTPDSVSLSNFLLQIEYDFELSIEKLNKRYYIIKPKKKCINGIILNKTSGLPVIGANIIKLKNMEGTISNEAGYFSLKNYAIDDSISISCIGYQPLTVPATHNDKILLTPINFQLNEVVIKEYLGSGISKNINGDIFFTPNRTKIVSGLSNQDILENIQLLPGIESPSESASELHIRGGSSYQNLILWDGIKLYNSSHFWGMLSTFNSYIIDNVTVSRSGTNPKYGDRISGVIDIKSNDDLPEIVSGELGFNMIHGDAVLKIPITKKIGVIFSGRRSFSELFRTPTFNRFSEKVYQNTTIEGNNNTTSQHSKSHEKFNFNDLTFKTILTPSSKDKLEVSSIKTNNHLDSRSKDYHSSQNDLLTVKNFGTSASWKRNWTGKLSSELLYYYSQYDFQYYGKNLILDTLIKKRNHIKEHSYSLHTDWQINNSISLKNGFQFFKNKTTYSFNTKNDSHGKKLNGTTYALSNLLEYKYRNIWRINLGLRTSYYSSLTSTYLEPRISIERAIGKFFRVRSTLELKNQAVNQLLEITTKKFGLENHVWALSEKGGIPLLTSEQVSLGALFSYKDWSADLDLYLKNNDGITSISNGINSSIEYYYHGHSLTRGIDVFIKKRFRNFSSWLSYTHSRTKFDFKFIDRGKSFSGNNDIKHSFSCSGFYKWNDFQISAGWKYRTGTRYTPAIYNSNTQHTIYGDINSKCLPNYHRLDLSFMYNIHLSKQTEFPKVKIGLSVLNVYNKRNILSREYNEPITPNNSLEIIDKYSLARTVNILLRLQF
jgi:hypothetical protein